MGLADGSLVRNGGVIQDQSGRVVMWLRELATSGAALDGGSLLGLDPVTGAIKIAMQGVNAGVTMRGFAAVNKRFDAMQGLLNITTASSVLSLGVSVIGFAVLVKKANEFNKKMGEVQKRLEVIDQKIDLSFSANFKAALELATVAFSMNNSTRQEKATLDSINRFLESQHTYTELIDQEISKSSYLGYEYLLTLCLAHIAELRCYLELEEFDIAVKRFHEGRRNINSRMNQYIDILLTSNPSMYLHPKLKSEIDLSRLTRVYRWKDSSFTENSVFELLRDKTVPQDDISWSSHIDSWIESLPTAIVGDKKLKKDILGFKKEVKEEMFGKLPKALETIESLIETSQRFTTYGMEIDAIKQLNMSFKEWSSLETIAIPNKQAGLLCITLNEPLLPKVKLESVPLTIPNSDVDSDLKVSSIDTALQYAKDIGQTTHKSVQDMTSSAVDSVQIMQEIAQQKSKESLDKMGKALTGWMKKSK